MAYTAAESTYIRANAGKMTIAAIARALGKNKGAIFTHIRRMCDAGVIDAEVSNRWREDEDDVILRLMNSGRKFADIVQGAKSELKCRTTAAIQARIFRHKRMGNCIARSASKYKDIAEDIQRERCDGRKLREIADMYDITISSVYYILRNANKITNK